MIYKLCEEFQLSKVTETVWQSGKSREKKIVHPYGIFQNWVQLPHQLQHFINGWTNFSVSQYQLVKPRCFLINEGKMFIKSRRGIKAYPDQGFSVSARPSFGVVLTAFESYSAEKVISDFGLHSRCNSVAIFPLSDNRVFTMVKGSIAWELPIEKLFW